MADQPSVPVCLTGVIVKLAPISSCMDSATHEVRCRAQALSSRLAARNDEVRKRLEEAEANQGWFTVCGYYVRGPECDYISVYSVEPAEQFEAKLKEISLLE